MIGPGNTTYATRDGGGISRCRWGDPSWTTIHVGPQERLTPEFVSRLLRRAYLDGFADRATLIRTALGDTTHD